MITSGYAPISTMQGGMKKITIFEQYLALYRKWCKIEPYLLWKANRKPHPSFRLVPVWMTFSDLQPHLKVTSIQRQINSKMVQHWAIPQWQTNRKSYKMFYRTTLFSMTLNDPTSFQGHAILWRWIVNISESVRDTDVNFQWNTNRDSHTPYLTVSYEWPSVTLSYLAKYSMTRAVYLR